MPCLAAVSRSGPNLHGPYSNPSTLKISTSLPISQLTDIVLDRISLQVALAARLRCAALAAVSSASAAPAMHRPLRAGSFMTRTALHSTPYARSLARTPAAQTRARTGERAHCLHSQPQGRVPTTRAHVWASTRGFAAATLRPSASQVCWGRCSVHCSDRLKRSWLPLQGGNFLETNLKLSGGLAKYSCVYVPVRLSLGGSFSRCTKSQHAAALLIATCLFSFFYIQTFVKMCSSCSSLHLSDLNTDCL
jgi:hypothetical protein